MSRYIDAEALIEDFHTVNPKYRTEIEWACRVVDSAPSIDLDTDVWCEDCKEYDKEHHNCPRFNRVIRTALEDADMVRVVRCKECKHCGKDRIKWSVKDNDGNWIDTKCNVCYALADSKMGIKEVSLDDYCSWGERNKG